MSADTEQAASGGSDDTADRGARVREHVRRVLSRLQKSLSGDRRP